MSAVYGISVEAATEIINQLADEMETVCQSFDELSEALEETAKHFELEFTIKENCLELEKLLLERWGMKTSLLSKRIQNRHIIVRNCFHTTSAGSS